MKLTVSILKRYYSFEKTLEFIEKSNADYIHVDVIDGLFANNKTIFTKKMLESLKKNKKPKDVHLMTLHLKGYIDIFSYIEPEYIIFQMEASTNIEEIISYIKGKNVKVGLAISPLTDINTLIPYLNSIDLVLVMSVIPGYGGQKFILSTKERINILDKLRKEYNANFKISVDGGIDDKTIEKLDKKKLDIAISGSYVLNSADLNKKIKKLK